MIGRDNVLQISHNGNVAERLHSGLERACSR
jgi:hypothetical protein